MPIKKKPLPKYMSVCENLGGQIVFPSFIGTRELYMHKTRMDKVVLPYQWKAYVKPVKEMLNVCLALDNVCYVTIDEKIVNNATHRKPGIHVDFNWYEGVSPSGTRGHGTHGIGGHGHGSVLASSGSAMTKIIAAINNEIVVPAVGYKGMPLTDTGGMLLVSNYPACQVWNGEFAGIIGKGGDCSGIDVSKLESEIIPAGAVYYINAFGIHESLPIKGTVKRQLIRINFHPDYVFESL